MHAQLKSLQLSSHYLRSASTKQFGSACTWRVGGKQPSDTVKCGAFRVTPYKLKEGESLSQVAEDRGLSVQELLVLNHELDPEDLDKNPTILVPQGKVSGSDRQVLDNMKSRKYRTYAAKANESIADILNSRRISQEEFESLNPDVDPDNLADHEIIKLPAHKYSPHEQQEMHGTLGSPQTFSLGSWAVNAAIIGTLAITWYCVWLYRQSQRLKKAAELEGKIAAARKHYKVPKDLPTPSYLASVDEANEAVDLPDPDSLKKNESGSD